MALKLEIGAKGDLAEIERRLADYYRAADAAITPETGRLASFEARMASDYTRFLFNEQWAGMAVSPGLRTANEARVVAWGSPELGKFSENPFLTSIPTLLAVQHDAHVAAQGRPEQELDPQKLRRYIVERHAGVLGSGRWREIVELDPDAGIAPVLNSGTNRRARFFEVVRGFMADMEIGAAGRRIPVQDIGYRRTALEFLFELHSNGWEHASAARGVRTLRVAKHFHNRREELEAKAGSFTQLETYIRRQAKPGQSINLVEASVSDFGPGILDGFLNSSAGLRYRGRDPLEVLDLLLHRKLSRKSADPNAGLGILNALNAARAMFGFVSLRTGPYWLFMDGSQSTGDIRLRLRGESHPHVDGTHWQLLYPDLTVG